MTISANNNGSIIAYYRVSTKRQNLSLDAQRQIVLQYATMNNLKVVAEFSEKESGKYDDRIELTNAIAECKKCGAKLVVSKLDRLSRSTEYLHHLYAEQQKGVFSFVALDLPMINDVLTFSVYAGIAQRERELISERTKLALSMKKNLGNPRLQETATPLAMIEKKKNAKAINAKAYKMAVIIREKDPRPTHIAKALNDLGVTTRHGKKWTCVQVQNLFKLYED